MKDILPPSPNDGRLSRRRSAPTPRGTASGRSGPRCSSAPSSSRGPWGRPPTSSRRRCTRSPTGPGEPHGAPRGDGAGGRAFLDHRPGAGEGPVRLYYIGPMFRHERPQKGRMRQFHQMGRSCSHRLPVRRRRDDGVPARIPRGAGLRGVSLELNSLGDPECRPAYHARLTEYLAARNGELCDDCRRRRGQTRCGCSTARRSGASVRRRTPLRSSIPCAARAATTSRRWRAPSPRRGPFFPESAHGPRAGLLPAHHVRVRDPGMGSQNTVAAGGRYDGLRSCSAGRSAFRPSGSPSGWSGC